MPLAALPSSTVKLIGSSQVVTSVSSVIKELMENSIDSGAQHIEIKLDKHGLEKIEVKDDGCGIGKSDATLMCLPHYTSKILDFSDLDSLTSYGFRGEALSSLCNVAQVSITTKTAVDEVATCYSYDHNGQVTCSKISHIKKGTIVTVTDLFKNLPVRKQFVSSSKRAAEELKRVEKVVKSLGMVHPRLRVTLVHNKFLIWQKPSVTNLRHSVMQVINLSIVKQLHHILHSSDQIRVEMLVPKRDSDVSTLCFSNSTDAYYLFVNNRPVQSKEIKKTVYNKLFEFFGVYVPANKYPVCVTCLTLPPDCLDVNLEPDKTRVYLKNQDEVLDFINQCMHIYYGEAKKEEENLPSAKHPKKRKVEEECPLEVDSKKVNLEQNEKILVEAYKSYLEQDQEHPNGVFNSSESHSSLETANCSGESTNKKESNSSNKDVDSIFEQFCLDTDTASSKTITSDSTQENPSQQELCFNRENPLLKTDFKSSSGKSDQQMEMINELPSHQELCLDSEILASKTHSKWFSGSNVQQIRNGKESSNSSNDISNNFIHSFKNINPQNVSEHEVNACKNTSSRKFECSKEAGQNLRTMDSYISKNVHPLPVQDEDCVNILNEKSYQYNNKGCAEEIHEQREQLESKDDRQEVHVSSSTLSQWSKGEIVNPTGVKVQGPQLLTKRVEPESPSTSQELTNRSVSSQMGCKEMSAFTKFARKMRKEILEEQPNLSFTKVAQILQVQWRHLDMDEKRKYEESIKIKKSPNSSQTSKQKSINSFLNNTPNIELEVSMDRIRQMVKEPIPEAGGEVRLVGRLEASPLWLYVCHSGVFTLSVTRLLEAVRYHQLLNEYALPNRLFSDNVTISPSDLSVEEWELLLSLERSPNGVIKDERFTNNGIIIEITEGDTEAQITYTPQNIAYCGIEEVQEILSMMQSHGPNASLAQCRPLKVISFIRSEVMRECSQQEPPSEPERVSELLSFWLSNVSAHTQACIHYRPVTQRLHDS